MNHQPGALGALPRTVKKTDYHADSYASGVPTPPSYSTPVPLIYMQNQEPCCGADLSTQYLNVLFGCVGSPEFFWKNVRKVDGLPASDGSESATLATVAKNTGVCDLSQMNDNSTVSNEIYASYVSITADMNTTAATRRIGNYAFIDNPTLQQIKDNIFTHKAVGLRVNCGDGWWANGWSETATCPLRLGNYVDGHFILATGYDDTYIYFANSWSTAWGKIGMGYFDKSYISNVLELIIFIPPVTPITPTPAKYTFTTFMMYGMTSSDIHQLQTKLNIPSTGFFGLQTLVAVAGFQKSHGLFPTGFVWTNTLSILNSS